MNRRACPGEVELSRAVSLGADVKLARHLAGCPSCRDSWEGLEQVIRLARTLPTHLPPAGKREQLRAALLAAAEQRPLGDPSGLAWAGRAAAVAAVLLLALWGGRAWRAGAPAHARVSLIPVGGARYSIVSPPPVQTVRLWEGTVAFDVEALGPGERFLVEVGDGEVEVRGTKFEVAASGDRLLRVNVAHGRVDVRPRGASFTVVGAGQTWRAARGDAREVAAAPPAPAARPVESLAPSVAKRPRRLAARATAVELVLRPTRQEILYDDAWDALRARDFKRAASGFSRVLADSPAGPLADEAAFWRATSLARGGEDAVVAFRELLATYPQSSRRGEACAILGWLLVDAHEPDEALRLFRAALQDPRETVRTSAREGLNALSARAPR